MALVALEVARTVGRLASCLSQSPIVINLATLKSKVRLFSCDF